MSQSMPIAFFVFFLLTPIVGILAFKLIIGGLATCTIRRALIGSAVAVICPACLCAVAGGSANGGEEISIVGMLATFAAALIVLMLLVACCVLSGRFFLRFCAGKIIGEIQRSQEQLQRPLTPTAELLGVGLFQLRALADSLSQELRVDRTQTRG